MVCRLMNVPISIFNLIDDHRQHYKSVQGLNTTDAAKDAAFCTHALNEDIMLLVPNAQQDERFHDNPFVTGKYLNIGFYAGCPVRAPDGMPVGTLCAIDMQPRDMSDEQLTALRDLAAMVETELKNVTLSKAQTSLVRELGEANRLALVDPLTRLWNRRGVTELLEREWADAARHGKPVTLVMADIDFFKKINDTFGHAVGDDVLRETAKRLLEMLRAEDAVGRMGGEEFLMILTDCDPSMVMATVDRIRKAIESRPFMIDGETYMVTMSFGAATHVPQSGDKPEETIEQADKALYRAKHGGRNRVELAAE